MPRRLGLVGPTASGKSAVAHQVAAQFGDVEIVSVDSMQVYRGMDIGTAKPTPAMRAQVRYHLLDVVDPHEPFTLRDFQRMARTAIDDIEARGHRPVLVGGTGLYLRAITDDLEIPGQYPAQRAELEACTDVESLHARLVDLDPLAASRMEPTNRRRIIRALEVTLGSGRPFSSYGAGLDTYPDTDWDLVLFVVEPSVLNERIALRYRDQLAAGFEDEVRALHAGPGGLGRTAGQALGYRQLADHLEGLCTLDEAIESAVAATRRFARRQRAWFGRDPRLTPMDLTTPDAADRAIEVLVARWGPGGVVAPGPCENQTL